MTDKTGRVGRLGFYVFCLRLRLLDLFVTIGATRALAWSELRAVGRIADGNDAKIDGQRLAMRPMRKGVIEVADLRPWESTGAERLVGSRDSPRLVTHAAEATRLAERSFEELGSEVVTSDARCVRKVLGHRLVCVFGLFFCGQMTIGALNSLVLFLIVRETAATVPIFRLFGRKDSCLGLGRRRKADADAPDH